MKNGVGLSTRSARGKRFPRLALQMIPVGEESGALDAMLVKTAETFEQRNRAGAGPDAGGAGAGVTSCWRWWSRAIILAVLLPIYDHDWKPWAMNTKR